AATLAGVAVPFLAFFASCAALAVSAVAAGLAWRKSRAQEILVPLLLIIAAIGVGIAQPLGLKVLALPKADGLPYMPVESRVVKTYGEGVWFEGIAAGPDGTLYLGANRGLDFARSDYWRDAEGQVIARSPDGNERLLFRMPKGSAAGVITIGSDGTLYMTSNGATPSVWRLPYNGNPELFIRLPEGAWPNGIDFGPDGKLYVADSNLGVVWRVDTQSGRIERAVDDKQLRARPFISLAPGANGLHFRGSDMIVTVSDHTTLLAYALQSDGRFGEPQVLATGIPGDDFAIGEDGSLYVTTHPYDTIVQILSSGERRVIGDARQRIIGATDAVFGRAPGDRDTLYVVTDGGAFTGGPHTRGELIALKPRALTSRTNER
ncbi:SMP-30/gluconolactonase/LRE family protein, partial [Noviherbaspirillum galbum]